MFSGVADTLDRVVCPSLYHVSIVQPEAVRSLARVVSVSFVAGPLVSPNLAARGKMGPQDTQLWLKKSGV